MNPENFEYYSIPGIEELESVDYFQHERSQEIYSALSRDREFNIIGIYKRNDTSRIDYIIIELTCDSVPSQNSAGILYRERIAIEVTERERRSIEVLMLRKNFPVLVHQNETKVDTPRSLCLYYETEKSVFRTWTAQKFLHRIKQWLELSAKGELHQEGQPVEQLFFDSPYELIFPWNWDEEENLFVKSVSERKNNNRQELTLHLSLEENPNDSNCGYRSHIIKTKPIVHGKIYRHPTTMDGLVKMFDSMDIDLVSEITRKVRDKVRPQGVPIGNDSFATIIILKIPISRSKEALPEKSHLVAFIILLGEFALGHKLDALILENGKYFSSEGVLGPKDLQINELSVFPMEVLSEIDAPTAQSQSGIIQSEFNGTIVGVGSLGSALLNLFIRSGQGNWKAIDNDHIKPHNLSRHIAFCEDIGTPKVFLLAEHCNAISNGATTVDAIYADGMDISDKKVTEALETSDIIIDCSTTLEYPRMASLTKSYKRHFSMFLTPDGDSSVFFAENQERSITLISMEPQYYRAIINEKWGDTHISNIVSTFGSGAGCRDFSSVMPYSKILVHAGILAQHFTCSLNQTLAEIFVWEQCPLTKSIVQHSIPVFDAELIDLDRYRILMDEGLKIKLQGFREKELPKETGGILLGYFDFNHNLIVLVDAFEAPADSVSSISEFERGTAGVQSAVIEASRKTGGIVSYIGEWHSHPRGHSTQASVQDYRQLAYLGIKMAEDGLPAVSLIVGDNDYSPYIAKTTNQF